MQFVVNNQNLGKNMTFIKKLSASLIIFVAILGLTACSEKDAETAGEKVDEMVKDAGNVAQDVGDKVGEMADDAGDAMEDAGEKVSEMAHDAGNAIEDACEKVKEGVEAEDTDC